VFQPAKIRHCGSDFPDYRHKKVHEKSHEDLEKRCTINEIQSRTAAIQSHLAGVPKRRRKRNQVDKLISSLYTSAEEQNVTLVVKIRNLKTSKQGNEQAGNRVSIGNLKQNIYSVGMEVRSFNTVGRMKDAGAKERELLQRISTNTA
jgi:hypothetical protein